MPMMNGNMAAGMNMQGMPNPLPNTMPPNEKGKGGYDPEIVAGAPVDMN